MTVGSILYHNVIVEYKMFHFFRYRARLQPDSVLHPVFRSRLLSIAADLNQNLTQSAFYKAQLLVRSFGEFEFEQIQFVCVQVIVISVLIIFPAPTIPFSLL